MKAKKPTILFLAATLLTACGSGSGSPSGPQYLPAGNYQVSTVIQGSPGTGVANLAICLTLGLITFSFSNTTATSDGNGNITLNLIPSGQVTFPMDINKNPCGEFSAENDTYTFRRCSNQGKNGYQMLTYDANNSPTWESASCDAYTTFRPQ